MRAQIDTPIVGDPDCFNVSTCTIDCVNATGSGINTELASNRFCKRAPAYIAFAHKYNSFNRTPVYPMTVMPKSANNIQQTVADGSSKAFARTIARPIYMLYNQYIGYPYSSGTNHT
jgi:hypothetical protein